MTIQGTIVPPDALKLWIEQTFGSLPDTLQQRVVRVTNRWTFEGATFNPFVARFVDRGNPLSPTSDIAALELFGSSVIASDPFAVASALRAEVK